MFHVCMRLGILPALCLVRIWKNLGESDLPHCMTILLMLSMPSIVFSYELDWDGNRMIFLNV